MQVNENQVDNYGWEARKIAATIALPACRDSVMKGDGSFQEREAMVVLALLIGNLMGFLQASLRDQTELSVLAQRLILLSKAKAVIDFLEVMKEDAAKGVKHEPFGHKGSG